MKRLYRVFSLSFVPLCASLLGCGGAQQGQAPAASAAPAPATARAWAAHEVRLLAGPMDQRVSRAKLGAYLPEVGRSAPVGVRPFSGPQAVPAEVRFDVPTAEAFLSTLAARINRPAVPGQLDFASQRVVPHQIGFQLEVSEALASLETQLAAGQEAITVPVQELAPEQGFVPEGLAFTHVLGEWTTRFARYGDNRNRGINVRRASRALSGAIIPAEGELSFNGRVGQRSRSRGYREAPVILRGELVDGLGGGVCQVSSTLYAAAFFAGLSFPQHTAHSRPSSYIRAGLDATVSWPGIDLVIRNPYSFPLYVHATTVRNRLTVQVYGAEKPREVELERRQGEFKPFEERVEDDPALSVGIEEVTQEGRRGRTVFRTRTLREGEREWVEQDEIVYPPVDRIVHVGTNRSFDLLFSD